MLIWPQIGGRSVVSSSPSDISVIITYYNRERYIDLAVQSVLAQSLKPLEILIVDDGSQEPARRYLDRYAEVCTIIDLGKNVGLSRARNAGVWHARGRFIAFLDDDDIWLPQKLEVQRRYMEQHPECAVLYSALWAFYANTPDVFWKCDWPPPLTLPQALTYDYNVLPSTMLVRTEVIRVLGGFDPCFRGSEDHEFKIRCCAAGYRIESYREPLVRLRREEHDSLTKRRWRMYRSDLRLLWKHKGHYYRIYGLRGFLSFLLATLHLAAFKTRYVDGGVRLLLRLVKVKWKVRAQYSEPVLRAKRADTGEQGG
jgi:teichuronic acid biosynthesis glycosyltransferase TuaG